MIDRNLCWRALVERDSAFDGRFYYSVKTTGVYCMPSCAAREPRPENVAFFETREEAENAGYRACKRCHPDLSSSERGYVSKVAEICRMIEGSGDVPRLDALAKEAGLSVSRFHRIFKEIVGVTASVYAKACRANRMQVHLGRGETSVSEAIYDAGFNSGSRFYESSNAMLGMTASSYKSGGENVEIRFATGECFLGKILVAASLKGICAIFLGDDPEILERDLRTRFPKALVVTGDADFEQTITKVTAFIEAPAKGLDLPLDIQGTAFQQRVWQALREIPIGTRLSYQQVAEKIGDPHSVRAVAKACASNSIAIAIPCHRVVRKDGDISGYRWGVGRKRKLLEREAESGAGSELLQDEK
jgi:AraC family transcriptional regulator of adaptative response/methylated-DNA-[protein]-cysteine methyltransferase